MFQIITVMQWYITEKITTSVNLCLYGMETKAIGVKIQAQRPSQFTGLNYDMDKAYKQTDQL